MHASATIRRRLHEAGGLTLHYREAGPADAPTLVLLHPSPRSSAMFVPWMTALVAQAPWVRVLALDTPGYGGSDALPASAETPPASEALADYVPPLLHWLQAVAGPRPVLYGSATGAQLGIALALRHPQALRHLVLDNAAHFEADAHAQIVARYFPDMTPQADGRHLATAWAMASQMLEFFPWFAADEAHRIAPQPPDPQAAHATLMDVLRAGPGYADAYRAAFAHERAEHVQALTVPTTLLRWQGSILLPHIDRLIAHALPSNVQVLQVPAPLAERQAVMQAHLLALMDARDSAMTPVTEDAA